jgi:hypothetical protein
MDLGFAVLVAGAACAALYHAACALGLAVASAEGGRRRTSGPGREDRR